MRQKLLLGLLLVMMVLPLQAAAQLADDAVARLIIFHSPTCPHCRYVLETVLPPLRAQYGEQLAVRLYDVSSSEGHAVFSSLLRQQPNLPTGVPQAYIGGHLLVGSQEIPEELPGIIEECLHTGSCDWAFETEESLMDELPALDPGVFAETSAQVSQQMSERFAGFNALTVATAGLLDGINPCAFTTIIFFVSYLALVGRTGKDVLLVGAAFTLAVFLTYLALGFGLATLLTQFETIGLIGRIVYALTALVCLVLAVLSLWDFVQIRRGKLTEIALQLPGVLKKRIHATIRTRSRMRGFVGAAFVAGVLVSIFELACTGQIYLPTIVFMTSVSDARLTAAAYLVLYCLMFVVPLIIVFGVTTVGTDSARLTSFFQRHVSAVKLVTAVLFSGLGVWLLTLVMV